MKAESESDVVSCSLTSLFSTNMAISETTESDVNESGKPSDFRLAKTCWNPSEIFGFRFKLRHIPNSGISAKYSLENANMPHTLELKVYKQSRKC